MSLTEARLTEAGGMRGTQGTSNRVREDYSSGAPSLDPVIVGTPTVASGGSTSIAVNKPTGATTGEMLVVIGLAYPQPASQNVAWTPPSGFTQRVDWDPTGAQQGHIAVFTKTVDGSEGSTFTAPNDQSGSPWTEMFCTRVSNVAQVVLGSGDAGGGTTGNLQDITVPDKTLILGITGNWLTSAQPNVITGFALVTTSAAARLWSKSITSAGVNPDQSYVSKSGGADDWTSFTIGFSATAPVVALYTDNFDRADGALASPWVSVEGALAVASNKLATSGGGPNTYRYNQTFAADQWAEGDCAGFAAGFSSIGPAVRVNAGGDLVYLWFANSPTNSVAIWKRIGGSYYQVGASGSPPTSPFKARLEVTGTSYKAYADGVEVASGTATDSSIATGQPGVLGANGTPATIDNYRCGDMPYTPSGITPTWHTYSQGGFNIGNSAPPVALTVPPWSVTAGELLVLYIGAELSDMTIPNPLFTVTGGGLTWVRAVEATASIPFNAVAGVFYAYATSTTTISNITVNQASALVLAYGACKYSGIHPSSPIGGTGWDQSPNTPYGNKWATLSALPAASSYVGGCCYVNATDFDATKAITHGVSGGFTELFDNGPDMNGSGRWGVMDAQHRTGFTNSVVPWDEIKPGGSYTTYSYGLVAVEIKAAP